MGLLAFFAEALRRLTSASAAPAPALPAGPTTIPVTIPQATPSLGDEKLIAALIQVESQSNDRAIGDKNLADHAYGCLQIRKPGCDDVSRGTPRTSTPAVRCRTSFWTSSITPSCSATR